MHATSPLGSMLLGVALAQAMPDGIATKVSWPFQLFNGTSIAETTSWEGGLDGPKIKPHVNATTFEWWYFDAVSTSSKNESITVVFYNHGPESFNIPYDGGPLTVQISGSFDNGTPFTSFAEATEGAVIETSTGGIRGDWKGSGSFFTGSNLQSPSPEYTVTINNPTLGIFGTMTLQPVSPPHYPCDIDRPGVSQEIIPHIYWSNAVPDAIATVNLTINGKPLQFTGNGFHDKNWGSVPLEDATQSWYWGHGRLGPYSLVWFDTLTPDGKEYFSSWVTKDGKVVSQSCESNSIVVRPWGENSEYPPARGDLAPSGFTLHYDMGQDGNFVANFTRELVTIEVDMYKRLIGSFSGGIEGGEQYEGRSLCEQFQF